MSGVPHPSTIAGVAHLLVVAGIAVRVIMRRPNTGIALTWLLIVSAFPFGGAITYLLIGERRISERRTRRLATLREAGRAMREATIRDELAAVDWSLHPAAAQGLGTLGATTTGSPALHGNRFDLFSDTQEIIEAIARDVDAATNSILMEFYIWNEGGSTDGVVEALIRAAGRGVSCRILVDALGARSWWKSHQPQRLRDVGIEVRPALPVSLWRSFVGRTDLRVHRKIVVIDGAVAWTGSMNMVDPRVFKQDAGVGEWVDAMTRLEGPAVAALGATMISDWVLESGEDAVALVKQAALRLGEPRGSTEIQVVASGPVETSDGLLQMLLGLINAARDELILTTPYLVPDESLLRAVRGAAGRGVRVALIVPEKVDSFMTRYASRSYYDDLLDLGVEIHLYCKGLLHTKSIMVDGTMSMFGTVNLDMRSLWLNYEVALFVYGREFTAELRALQQSYIDDSDPLDPATWNSRSVGERFLENTFRLVSPLL